MSCDDFGAFLDDFVDEELTPDARLRVERHLSDCAACRRRVEATRGLLRDAAALPRSIAPARDLYPSLRAALGSRPEALAATARPPSRWTRWAGLAAGLAVVALAATSALWLGPRPGGPGTPDPLRAEQALPAGLEEADDVDGALRVYVEAAELLSVAIDERRDRLSPETLVVLERNLEIIDRAISDVRAALEREPSSRENAQALRAMHEQKVELLRWVSRLVS